MKTKTNRSEDTVAEKAPSLVLRWRIAHRKLPIMGRHIASLAHMNVDGVSLTSEFRAWVKQHIESLLAAGALEYPDGVLTISVMPDGSAIMEVVDYQPLLERLKKAGVVPNTAATVELSPDTINLLAGYGTFIVDDGGSLIISPSNNASAAMASLIKDLAHTLKIACKTEDDVASYALQNGLPSALLSDEFGVVMLTKKGQSTKNCERSELLDELCSCYVKLLSTL